MAEFIEEVEVAAVMVAKTRDQRLTVDPVEYGVAIDGNRQLLAAAVANLLQNAFKFNRPHGSVRLRTHTAANRVLIDVEDECGGLPPGKLDALWPLQPARNRSHRTRARPLHQPPERAVERRRASCARRSRHRVYHEIDLPKRAQYPHTS